MPHTHSLAVSPPAALRNRDPSPRTVQMRHWNTGKPELRDGSAWRSGDSESGRELPERTPGPLRLTRSLGWQAGQHGTEAEPAKSTGVGVGVIRRQEPRPGPIVLTEGAWVWPRIPFLSTGGTSSPTETQGPG